MSKSNREILLEGSMVIEQFNEYGEEETPLTIHMTDYEDCVDNALKQTDKESVMTKLIDNISDATGWCVLTVSIDEDELVF